jgi:hypothetical protein
LIGREAGEAADGAAGGGAEEGIFGFGLGGRLFGDGRGAGLEPAEEPVVDLEAGVVGERVGQWGGGPGEVGGLAEEVVDSLEFLELFPAAGDVLGRVSAEVILITYADEEGFGGEGIEHVPAVEVMSGGVDEVLFGIVGGAGSGVSGAGVVFVDGA